ncbi:MAG TPA: IPT/TIG domain-containing protein [Thermoanaerobaculia bacterium]|nr:IPT/TIG domain-containing protein [Thermoanaerobaculia bacterium]
MRLTLKLTFLVLLATSPLAAQTNYTITPDNGPTSGGTHVTIKGDFGQWPYGVIFGGVSVPATRVDEHTLTAVTPPHMPGKVEVVIFEFDIGINTDLTFDYIGPVPDDYARLLLPVFTPPVHGAFGSLFFSNLRVLNYGGATASIYGLEMVCAPILCIPFEGPFDLGPGSESTDFVPNGNPGRFVYVKKDQAVGLAMNLRVYDTTREALNFGTEIPIVREEEMPLNRVVFTGVPTDPRFRNTLRIYSTFPFTAIVTIGNRPPVRVRMSDTNGIHDPSYAQFGDFPTDGNPVRVTIDAELDFQTLLPVDVPIWAMITVTNNETQMISTITPQP